MNPSSPNINKILVSGIAVVFVVAISVYFWLRPASAPTGNVTSPANNAPAQVGPTSTANTQPSSTVTALPANNPVKTNPPPATQHLLPSRAQIVAPSAGDYWIMNRSHLIEWTNALGVGGSLVLADANTKKVLGWILQHTDPGQTFFSWDTANLYTSQTYEFKKGISPGRYVVRLLPDKSYAASESVPVTIYLSGATETLTYAVRLENDTVSPKVLTASKGVKVVFVNANTVTRTVTFAGLDPLVIAPNGGSVLFNTSPLLSGLNYYTSDAFREPASIVIQ